jgi:hypothetical protein
MTVSFNKSAGRIRFDRLRGCIEQSLGVNIAPNRTNFLQLSAPEASITHDFDTGIPNSFAPGNLVLIMLCLDTVRDNRSPARRDAS